MEKLAVLIFLAVGAYADSSTSNSSLPTFPNDPYLQYQPSFAYSLPIQILITGIVFTLVLVLFIHLLFTVQYHWPLARLNYILQLCGVVTLLIWLSATLIVVLKHAHERSKGWPYMLDYVAVDIPSSQWTDTQEAWWLVMESTTSGLVHITHIQFLTLLYPSGIEARLIFLLLGPLAIASSGMVFTSMNSAAEVRDLGDAVRNVCNSALSLLFTAALLAWGFVIHRTPAWRTDGGTAAFGIGAIILAVLSTVSNFLQIFLNRRIHWLLSLTWAIVLWQSFLGWWWWVGSGEGINEVEDMLERERRRRRKRAKKRKKEAQAAASGADPQRGILRNFRRRGSRPTDDNEGGAPSRAGTSSGQDNASSHPDGSSHPENTLSNPESHSHSTSSHTSTAPSNAWGRAWASIRHAHRRATTVQAIEQVELRNTTPGWGLGSFGVMEAERRRAGRQVERREGERRLVERDDATANDTGDWFVQLSGEGYRLKNVESGGYLAMPFHGDSDNRAYCGGYPTTWILVPNHEHRGYGVYGIMAGDTDRILDLTDWGNAANGTLIYSTCRTRHTGATKHMAWKFEHLSDETGEETPAQTQTQEALSRSEEIIEAQAAEIQFLRRLVLDLRQDVARMTS
ncbi:unnamed protein product [Rhizoctonia solani]|uniref:Ricin B lectin domain-containing protein n=1 Tax=Rhizoctonia solani TaxID=456999 RepID=A0A8H3ALB5_9AGAM|nr:unnamed protein product [Rhizoctonia solani]